MDVFPDGAYKAWEIPENSGARENEHPLKYADRASAQKAARNKKVSQMHLAEISELYVKVLLLFGALILAFSMLSPFA